MTQHTKHAPRRAALPAATLAALLLAGCSSGNIGESWQCPLAKGGSCDSVAAADPAVPDAGGRTVLGEPLWQARERAPEPRSETACTAGCDGGFDPFAWLARLFQAEAHEGDAGTAGAPAQAPSASVAQPSDPVSGGETDASAEPAPAVLPAEPAVAEVGPQADDLRTGEVVARIWIAPFVDAGGVYREASHVRVVLEPAGWRLK
ncbi:MAG: TraV family lipoprotein [Acidobacteriota bacterium]|nr:TraV family lipoprotein [Acidobacteriota bacterium]